MADADKERNGAGNGVGGGDDDDDILKNPMGLLQALLSGQIPTELLGPVVQLLGRMGINVSAEPELTAEEKKIAFGGAKPSLKSIADRVKDGELKRVVVLSGAGISVAAGIPDFRTPGTGLYDNLQKYNLGAPEDIFTLSFFKEKPEPFFTLAKELFPGNFAPTLTHHFIRLLNSKGVLLRCYTQNIDDLERVADLPAEKLVQVHGTFSNAHCIGCRAEYPVDRLREEVLSDKIPRCLAEGCGNLVKPDIVFFGEGLPERYFELSRADLPQCDLLLVLGTSLKVAPVSQLPLKVPPTIPRVLINREMVGNFKSSEENYRDVCLLGDIDEQVMAMAEMLGWAEELRALHAAAPHPPARPLANAVAVTADV